MKIPSLNLPPKEDAQMEQEKKKEVPAGMGKLNIGKAVAIQQQQLEKNEKLTALPVKDVEEHKKLPALGLNLPAKVEQPKPSAQLSLALGNSKNLPDIAPEIKRGGDAD